MVEEGADLVLAQATHPAGEGDADVVHDLASPHATHAGHGLEQGRDAHLADHVIGLAVNDDLGQGAATMLEAVLDLGSLAPGGSGLPQGGGALFRGEGRECPERRSFCESCDGWLLNHRLWWRL